MFREILLCSMKFCCVLRKFVAFYETLLCFGKSCCVLRNFVVFRESVFCSLKMCFNLFFERFLGLNCDIELPFALVGHRTIVILDGMYMYE